MKRLKAITIFISLTFVLSACSSDDGTAESLLPKAPEDVTEYVILEDNVGSISAALGDRRVPYEASGWHVLNLPAGVPKELVPEAAQFEEENDEEEEPSENQLLVDKLKTEMRETVVADITVDPETGEKLSDDEIKAAQKAQKKAQKKAEKELEKAQKALDKENDAKEKALTKKTDALQKEYDKRRGKLDEDALANEDAAIAAAIEAAKKEELTYKYSVPGNAAADIEEYYGYLTEYAGFKSKEPLDNTVPAGYLMFSKPSESKEGYNFCIDIDYTWNDYNIKLYLQEMPADEQMASEMKKVKKNFKSRDEAVEALQKIPTSTLGIAERSDYYYMPLPGRNVVNGKSAFGISVYMPQGDGANLIAGTFYLPLDRSCVYKYDILTDTMTEVYGEILPEPEVKEADNGEKVKKSKTEAEKCVESYDLACEEEPLINPLEAFMRLYPQKALKGQDK